MKSSLNDNFCSSPWFHIRINSNGDFVPCRWDFSHAISNHNIKNTSMSEYMNSDVMRKLRIDLLEGNSTTTCASCNHEDTYNKVSGRQRQLLKSVISIKNFDKTFCASPHWNWFEYSYNNHGYTECLPVDLQIDLGNTCNSACVMCMPLYSSKLATEYIKLRKIDPILFDLAPSKGNWTDDPNLVDKFVDELSKIPNIRYIHFLGGETLYIPSLYAICQKLIDMGIAKNVSVGTTTNGTIYTTELEKVFKSFKQAHLGISIESLHPVNDYIRWPGKISSIEKNILSFIELRNQMDLQLSLRITPSILSIYHIDTLFEFMIEHSVTAESCNILTTPTCLRIELLPKNILDEVVIKIDKVIEKYNLVEPTELLVNRRNETKRDEIISKVIFEYKHTIENLQPPEDVEFERYNLIKFLKGFESIHNNSILDYLPEYEEFLRRYSY